MPSGDSARSQQARIAALTRSSREPSGAAMTSKSRKAFVEGFYDRTDPELPEDERRRQQRAALSAHMRAIAQRRRPGTTAARADAADIRRAVAELAELAGLMREALESLSGANPL